MLPAVECSLATAHWLSTQVPGVPPPHAAEADTSAQQVPSQQVSLHDGSPRFPTQPLSHSAPHLQQPLALFGAQKSQKHHTLLHHDVILKLSKLAQAGSKH